MHFECNLQNKNLLLNLDTLDYLDYSKTKIAEYWSYWSNIAIEISSRHFHVEMHYYEVNKNVMQKFMLEQPYQLASFRHTGIISPRITTMD